MKNKIDDFLRLLTVYVLVASFVGLATLRVLYSDNSLGILNIVVDFAVALTFAFVFSGLFILIIFIICAVAEALGLEEILFKVANFILVIPKLFKNTEEHQTEKLKIIFPRRYILLRLTRKLFSKKTQKEIFEQTMSDWDYQVFEAEKHNERDQLAFIHIRNLYRFLGAMWQKSPIGDLIEFVIKIAKQ